MRLDYHDHYGYPYRWAIPAEIMWRVEHVPFSYEGQPLERLACWGYRWRKRLERRGSLARSGR